MKVSVNPEIFIPGKPVQLQWTIDGRALDSGAEVVVTFANEIIPSDADFADTVRSMGELRFTDEKGSGTLELMVKRTTEEPLEIRVTLEENGKAIDEQIIWLGEAKYTVEKNRDGKIEAWEARLE